MRSYKLNYTKKQAKENFINIGNHQYNILCSNGKLTIPIGKQTLRYSGYYGLALKESMDKLLTKEEFNVMFPQIAGKKYIAPRICAKIAYEKFGRKDIIFAEFPEGKGRDDYACLYTF